MAEGRAARESKVVLWWPPRVVTMELAPKRFVRIEVDERLAEPTVGLVFETRAAADEAAPAAITRLPAGDGTGAVRATFEDIGTRRFEVRSRTSTVVAAPILMSSRKRFDVVRLGDDQFVGVRRADIDDVDSLDARVHPAEALAAADRERAVRLPEATGSYDAVVISPDGSSLIAFEVIVADEIERSAIHGEVSVLDALSKRPLRMGDDIGLVPAKVHGDV